MTRKMKMNIILLLVLMPGLSACASAGLKTSAVTPTQITSSLTPPHALATPVSQEPAAGICASFEGEMVTINIQADIPDPRCAKVRADQKLTVINQTQGMLQVSIGTFEVSLEPGKEHTFDVPFGEYLAPGVHLVQISPCCGPELWLEGK